MTRKEQKRAYWQRYTLIRAERRGEREVYRHRMLQRVRLESLLPRLIADYRRGMSLRQLAAAYGLNKDCIRKRLVRCGIERDRLGGRPGVAHCHCGKPAWRTPAGKKYARCRFHVRQRISEQWRRNRALAT